MEHVSQYLTKIYTSDLDDASGKKELIKLPIPAGIKFGNTVVVDSAAGFIYIYRQKKDWIIHRPLVARASMEEDIAATREFFDGNG